MWRCAMEPAAGGSWLTDESLTDEGCAHHFDHLSEELAQRLPETMARVRGHCPVARSDAHGGFWVVSGYEEALSAAQNWASFSSAHGLSILPSPTVVRNLPVEVDPPIQRVYKRLVNPSLTPPSVGRRGPPTSALRTAPMGL